MRVINIQKYSLHDGDGIRTTIFFKGCPLNCKWCHNPESQNFDCELLFDAEKCVGCGYCAGACANKAICISEDGVAKTDRSKCELCETCLDYCVQNCREIAGKEYTVAELVKEALKDRMFYEQSGGGVTLSGGEVMMQNIDQLEDLCRRLHQEGIHLAIDTCGFAPTENYQRILPYVDVFLYDIKALDEEVHQAYTGQSNKLILENLEFLAKNRANINIRIPVIDPVNANEEFMKDVISYLKEKVGIGKVNLLPYHNTGSSKYAKMELVYPSEEFRVPSEEQMESFKQLFMDNGFSQVKIGG